MVIGVIVMWAMVAALVLCAALWPLARHADRQGRPGLLHSALSSLRRLTLSTLLALSAVFTISVAHSGKNMNNGTGTTGILPVATGANGYAIPTGGTPVVPGVWGIISGPDGTDSSYAQTSVVRVEIEREKEAPENNRPNRHDYGIGEYMRVCQYPTSPSLDVTVTDAKVLSGSLHRVEWGVSNVEHTLSLSLNRVEYVPLVRVLTPTGIQGYDAQTKTNGLPVGVAGGLLLVQRYKVLPLTVNFEGIKIQEVPCYDAIPPTGYFIYADTNEFPRTHSSAAGAGNLWMSIESGNCVKSSIRDCAGFEYEIYRMMPNGTTTTNTAYGWLGGSLTWKVPFGWVGFLSPSSAESIGVFAWDVRQITSITETGDFSVEKLGHKATRQINGVITLDENADDGILDN